MVKKIVCDGCGNEFDATDGHFEMEYEGCGMWAGGTMELCFNCGRRFWDEILELRQQRAEERVAKETKKDGYFKRLLKALIGWAALSV